MQFERALVVGASGGFGRRFRALFVSAGIQVTGVDLGEEEEQTTPPSSELYRHHHGDAAAPDEIVSRAAHEADFVVFCLPEDAFFRALKALAPHLRRDSVVVDILSVKSPVAEAVSDLLAPDVEALSLQPLFAPDLSLAGQNVLAVPLRPGPRGEFLLDLMAGAGARVTRLTVAQHDRRAAKVQAAGHAAILAYGLFLMADDEDSPADLMLSSTPPYRTLAALFARIVSQDPDVYWRLQIDNPYADSTRRRLMQHFRTLDDAFSSRNAEAFRELLEQASAAFGDDLGTSLERCRRLFAIDERSRS